MGPSPRVSWEFPRDMAAMSDVAVYQDKVRMLEEKLSEEKKVTDGVQGRLAEEMSRGEGLRRQLQEVTLQKTALGQAKDEAEVKLAQVSKTQGCGLTVTRCTLKVILCFSVQLTCIHDMIQVRTSQKMLP